MPVTREYLEEQAVSLKKQAEQSLIAVHNANGALSAIMHLLEVMDREAAAPAPALPSPDQTIQD
jgi:hypothetical protein